MSVSVHDFLIKINGQDKLSDSRACIAILSNLNYRIQHHLALRLNLTAKCISPRKHFILRKIRYTYTLPQTRLIMQIANVFCGLLLAVDLTPT